MGIKDFFLKRKYYLLSTILSFVSGITLGYCLLDTTALLGAMVWIGGTVSFTWAVNILLWAYKEIKESEEKPKPEIRNPIMKAHNVSTKHEFKELFFDVKNSGKIEARDCKIKIKVKDIWNEFETLTLTFRPYMETFNLVPDDERPIHLCQITKRRPTTTAIPIANMGKYPALTKGIYQLELRLIGSNFLNRKIYKLKLDLSSWENIGLTRFLNFV